jgi:hypothetical protein
MREIKKNDGGVNLTRISCKHFCKCHNEPPVKQYDNKKILNVNILVKKFAVLAYPPCLQDPGKLPPNEYIWPMESWKNLLSQDSVLFSEYLAFPENFKYQVYKNNLAFT